jgi:hypothetical protein
MVDDLGNYDVAPVDGNPFGAMADSPQNYDVAPVDHNPFAGPAPLPAPAPPMTSADITARGGIGTLGPGSFAPSDQARQLVQMGLEGAGMSRGTAQDISGNFSTEAGALPGTGQLLSGADALYHAGRGEYGQAALSGAGAVPDVGPLAHATGAMFLGPVARFADREGLGAAKTALQAGEHPYDVWSQHLWEHGPGDSWRTEIADPTQTGQWGQHGETKEIGDIYPHPELYQNYPGLESTPVDFIGGEHLPPGAMGAYDENNDRFLMNADLPPGERAHTLTHELQHKVQGIEGWPGGADPEKMDVHKPGTPGNFALNFILNQTTAAQRKAMGRDAIVNEAKRFAYETKTGEAQAENPFARLGMSMSERRAAYPATTEQIPRGNQWWTDPRTGKLSFGQDVEPRASGGPVQLNGDLRRRLALVTQPRHGFADGGASDEDPLGSSVTMAPDQTVDAPIPYTPEDIDQPGPMTETLAHYAGNPANAMPMRIGAAIGEEAKRMGQGLWSAATVPGDVASGKASMADPETQQRVTSLAASLPGGGPESALGARGPVGAAAKAVKGAPATRELNVWNPATGQWEGPKPTPNPPAGTTYDPLFNFDPALMNKVPDVPQFELQRYDPPRGVSDRMRDLVTNSDVRKQMIDIVKNGMQTVGLSWYNTGQLRAMFLKELGDDAGQQAFEKYMNLVSATSPENKIPQNIRTASYFYERDAAGVPPPERGDPIAEPYGSKAQKLHQQNVGNVLTEGYDVLKNPKPPSFVQNLMGNYAPGTMDRHAFKLPAILSKDPRFLETSFTPEKGAEPVRPQQMFQNGDLTMEDAVNQPTMWAGMPNKNEYAALEGWYKSIGDELGITPAQVQASAWVGGGHITGLASAADETFLHSFQGRVFNTAHHTGQTPSEVVKKMIRGEQPLLSGGPGMVPTAAQTSTAGAGGSPPPPSDQAEPGHPFY